LRAGSVKNKRKGKGKSLSTNTDYYKDKRGKQRRGVELTGIPFNTPSPDGSLGHRGNDHEGSQEEGGSRK